MPQMTGLIYILNFRIRQSSYTVGTPVDNTATLVNQTLLIQRNKDLTNCCGATFIHGKTCTIPIAGCTQLLLLFNNTIAVLMLPIPNTLKELFSAQIVTAQAFLGTQFFFNLNLSCNTCMVNTGNPQSIITLHALKANQGILQSRVHCMTHVQLTCNIGRRHYNGKRLRIVGLVGLKMAIILPHLINSVFNLLRFINLRQFSCHNKHSFKQKRPEQTLRTKRFPWYHLNFRILRTLNSYNGHTRTSLL